MANNKWYRNAFDSTHIQDTQMSLATITDAYFLNKGNFKYIDIILKRSDGARTKWFISDTEWCEFFENITKDYYSFLEKRDNTKLKDTLCGRIVETYSYDKYLKCISTVDKEKSLLYKCEQYLNNKK